MNRNLVVEKGGKLTKWPKCKARLVNESPEERMDTVLMKDGKGRPSKLSKAQKSRDSVDPDSESASLDPYGGVEKIDSGKSPLLKKNRANNFNAIWTKLTINNPLWPTLLDW